MFESCGFSLVAGENANAGKCQSKRSAAALRRKLTLIFPAAEKQQQNQKQINCNSNCKSKSNCKFRRGAAALLTSNSNGNFNFRRRAAALLLGACVRLRTFCSLTNVAGPTKISQALEMQALT